MAKRRKRRKRRRRASTRSKRRMSMSSRRRRRGGRRKSRRSRRRRRNPEVASVVMSGLYGGLGWGIASMATGYVRSLLLSKQSATVQSIASAVVPAAVSMVIGGLTPMGRPRTAGIAGPIASGMLLYSGMQAINAVAVGAKLSANTQRFLGLTNVASAAPSAPAPSAPAPSAPSAPPAQPSTGSGQGFVVEVDNSSMPPKVISKDLGVTLSLSQLKADDNGFLTFVDEGGKVSYLVSKNGKPLVVHQAGTIIESDSGFQASMSGMMPPYGGPGFPGYDNPQMPQMPILAGWDAGYGTMAGWDAGYGTMNGLA